MGLILEVLSLGLCIQRLLIAVCCFYILQTFLISSNSTHSVFVYICYLELSNSRPSTWSFFMNNFYPKKFQMKNYAFTALFLLEVNFETLVSDPCIFMCSIFIFFHLKYFPISFLILSLVRSMSI